MPKSVLVGEETDLVRVLHLLELLLSLELPLLQRKNIMLLRLARLPHLPSKSIRAMHNTILLLLHSPILTLCCPQTVLLPPIHLECHKPTQAPTIKLDQLLQQQMATNPPTMLKRSPPLPRCRRS